MAYGFSPYQHLAIIPSAFIGARGWWRDITGVGGYNEHYYGDRSGVGLEVDYTVGPVVLGGFYDTGSAYNSGMQASISSDTFTLGKTDYTDDGLKATWVVSPKFRVWTQYSHTQFGYGASPVYPDGYMEPSSTTKQDTVAIGISVL